jgi:hypothetical protein
MVYRQDFKSQEAHQLVMFKLCLPWLVSDTLSNRYWDTHGKTYKMNCAEAKIDMYPGVEPAPDNSNNGPKNGQITLFMRPKQNWTKEGLLEHIIELVVVEDQVNAYICSL